MTDIKGFVYYIYSMTCTLITGSQEERDWAADHRHSAVDQTGDPHHHRVQGSWLCIRQGHLGTYHLRIR